MTELGGFKQIHTFRKREQTAGLELVQAGRSNHRQTKTQRGRASEWCREGEKDNDRLLRTQPSQTGS